MPFLAAHDTLAITVRQRCFWLFAALLLVVTCVPFLEDTANGRIVLNALGLGVLIAGTAAIGRSRLSLVIALLLATSAVTFQALGYSRSEESELRLVGMWFSAAFYFVAVSYLLAYALRREVLTMDKLYGAAAAFLMLAILWTYFYGILLWNDPAALALNGEPLIAAPPSTILYFSIATLTATGMSDILPVQPVARMLAGFEMITGVLFIAVLIARLAGTYPPQQR
jgi:Ion channel